jgi:hypothetical protein
MVGIRPPRPSEPPPQGRAAAQARRRPQRGGRGFWETHILERSVPPLVSSASRRALPRVDDRPSSALRATDGGGWRPAAAPRPAARGRGPPGEQSPRAAAGSVPAAGRATRGPPGVLVLAAPWASRGRGHFLGRGGRRPVGTDLVPTFFQRRSGLARGVPAPAPGAAGLSWLGGPPGSGCAAVVGSRGRVGGSESHVRRRRGPLRGRAGPPALGPLVVFRGRGPGLVQGAPWSGLNATKAEKMTRPLPGPFRPGGLLRASQRGWRVARARCADGAPGAARGQRSWRGGGSNGASRV